jgi:prophage maintenance system killer protein
LITINREVVSLTSEKHELDESDERRLKALVREVRRPAGEETFEAVIVEEASIVMFRIATGQHFHEGNKRTSLVAGLAFLNMNGYRSISGTKSLLL